MRLPLRVFSVVWLLAAPVVFAHAQDGPPAPPFPAPFASRGTMVHSARWIRSAEGVKTNQQTAILPLSAGITLISIPLRTDSQLLSDLLPNLPSGSRVWTWDAFNQQFIEGFDQELPAGQGAMLYVPAPAIITITGTIDDSTDIPVDLQNGWNLIGVPYTAPLPRASQTVYVGGVEGVFNDAVDQGDLQEPVYGADSSGYREVGPDDSFEPMNAYWIFSTDAELLELQPLLLGENDQGGTNPLAKWTAEKLGNLALNYVVGTYFPSLVPNPNKDALAQLATMSDQLTQIQTTQSVLLERTTDLEKRIGADGSETRQLIGEAPIKTVEGNLRVNYDSASPLKSYMWFDSAVKKATDPKNPDSTVLNSITAQNKFDFANNVINVWDYEKQFESIQLAVLPSSGNGVLENYAASIVLGGKKGTLEDRYRAFEEYFNWILGVQLKCMILITNAYNELAVNPLVSNRAIYAGYADAWRTGPYANAVEKEVKRFRAAVETILAGTLVIGSQPGQPAVSVPGAVQDVAMRQADLLAMNLLKEPEGLRLRVLVAPDMNTSDKYTLTSFTYGVFTDLPSTDSSSWQRMSVDGAAPYDSWQIDATNRPKFFVRKDWLLWRSGPLAQTLGVKDPEYRHHRVFVNDALRYTEQPPVIDFQVPFVDTNGNAVSSGPRFASRVIAVRASANTMLATKNGQADKQCGSGRIINVTGQNKFLADYCRNSVTFSQQVPFTFGGGSPSFGDWEMSQTFEKNGWTVKNSYGYIRLWDQTQNNTIMSDLNVSDSGSYTRVTNNIQWQTDRTYVFEMNLRNNYLSSTCDLKGNCATCEKRGSCPANVRTSVTRNTIIMRFR